MKIRLKKNNKVYEAKMATSAYYSQHHPGEPLYTWDHLPYIHDAEEQWVKLCGPREYEIVDEYDDASISLKNK